MDCSPPGSSVHGISQARTLEWVAISFSKWFYEGSTGYGTYEVKHSPFVVSFLPGSQWYYPVVFICIFQVRIAGDAYKGTHSSSVSSP